MLTVTALYDYTPPDDSGLSFKKGDIITVHNQLTSGWWDGACNGERGWFPCNYVSQPTEQQMPMSAQGGITSQQQQQLDTPISDVGATWIRQQTAEGQIYYLNRFTGETSWEASPRGSTDSLQNSPRPSGDSATYSQQGGINGGAVRDVTATISLPPGWIVFEAEDGSMVYYNGFTKETRWTPPEGTTTVPVSAGTSGESPVSPGVSVGGNGLAPQGMRARSGSMMSARQAANEGLPPNWGKKMTADGRLYYYNMLTDQTTWNLSDINPETGDLLTKPASLRDSTQSDSSGPDSLRRPSIADDGRWTWNKLMTDIVVAIQQLDSSARHNYKGSFIPQSSAIVEAIRIMLFASGTARKDAPLVESHRQLKVHHRNIMATLSRLVLSAKTAAGVWPPPDAISNMQAAASDVLVAVRNFVAAAQEAGVEIRSGSEGGNVTPTQMNEGGNGVSLTSSPVPHSVANTVADHHQGIANAAVTAAAQQQQQQHQQMFQQQQQQAYVSGGGIVSAGGEGPSDALGGGVVAQGGVRTSVGGVSENDEDEGPQQTNSEIVAQLERYTANVVDMISALVSAVRNSQGTSSMLITDVRSMVTEVGNFLAVVDDLPLDAFSEDLTMDFKINRVALYNSISGLVMATYNATSQFAPANAVEQVIVSTGLVEKAVKDLLISTKFLVEEKEALEQQTLQRYIDQYGGGNRRPSEVQVRPRRAMSLSILGPNSGDPNAPPGGVAGADGSIAAPGSSGYGGYDTETLNSSQNSAGVMGSDDASGGRPASASSTDGTSLMPPMSAPLARLDLDGDDLMASLSRKGSARKSKIQKLLGAEAPMVVNNANKNSDSATKAKPWYLNYDYSPDDIVFNMESKIKGGKLEVLVERLTLHDTMDPIYLQAFLLTYRSFTTTTKFFNILTKRFLIMPPPGLSDEEIEDWNKAKRQPIRLRVFNVMKSWVETYCQDDEEDKMILTAMKQFATTTMAQEIPAIGNQLLKLIERREQGGMKKILVTTQGRDVPPPILPRSLRRIKFLDLDALEVARQLTIIESKEYNKLQPTEFLKKAWSDKENNFAVNVKAMIETSNQVAGWVAQSILSEKEPKKRASLIKHFINIAERCRLLNNFNTLMAILAGLNTAPIHRLNRTWELLSAKSQQSLESLRATMDSTKNFSRYRETLHSINPPCVPFLGFYLTDLTFIEDGSPDMLKGAKPDMINFSKRMKTAEVIREIQQYQNVPYLFTPVPELQQFLKQSFLDTADEGDLYNMSLLLEPREREEEKITRLLTESGFLN
ncbi:hypothetical protein HDU76_013312 [Blyttiomyces sp. JEL0837]|nr:hypothetical protein HDU76_013312 [Blyttiomyces sp. JEL0837]